MRRIRRRSLPDGVNAKLQQKQAELDGKLKNILVGDAAARGNAINRAWGRARKGPAVKEALGTLRCMAGPRERCMYCGDSRGTDIDHFWPKTRYPERTFKWQNMLLNCTPCGRHKGVAFPLDQHGHPLLLDPSADDPWQHLDLDPDTGDIVARFDKGADAYSRRGEETVKALKLDQVEAVSRGRLRALRRVSDRATAALNEACATAAKLVDGWRRDDDYGVIEWCLVGGGRDRDAFKALREQRPDLWLQCVALLEAT